MVDDSNRLRERNASRPSSTTSASTDHVECDCEVGTDIEVYDGRVGISYPVLTAAPPPHDTDKSGGTFCYTDSVALSTLSSDKERILREEQLDLPMKNVN